MPTLGLLSAASTACHFRSLLHVSFTTSNLLQFSQLAVTTLVMHAVLERQWSTRRWTACWVCLVATVAYFLSLKFPDTAGNQVEVPEFGICWVILGLLLTGGAGQPRKYWLGEEEGTSVRDLAWVRLAGGVFALLVVGYQQTNPVKMDLITTPYFVPEYPRTELILFALMSGIAPALFASATAPTSYSHSSTLDSPPLTPALLHALLTFSSIFLNALVFRRASAIPAKAWTAVGWVLAGYWIKDDPRFDDADAAAPKGSTLGTFDSQGRYTRVHSSVQSKADNSVELAQEGDTSTAWRQYAPALLLPPLLVVFCRGLFFPSPGNDLLLKPGYASVVNASTGVVLLEGGEWEAAFHSSIAPVCLSVNETRRWPGTRRTVLASHERSGNTWTRELVERSTGWQTSTIAYCDAALLKQFKGECDHNANLLVKTHYPRVAAEEGIPASVYIREQRIDQAIHVVRNPIDSIYSEWQLAHYPKKTGPNGEVILDHAGRLEIGLLGQGGRNRVQQRKEVLRYAEAWKRHEEFWATKTVIPTLRIRYEDLIHYKLPSVLSMLSFLLPPTELPSLSHVSCVLQQDIAREAYRSRHSPPFDAWNKWDKDLREEVIKVVTTGWCRHGYGEMLAETIGQTVDTGLGDLCNQ